MNSTVKKKKKVIFPVEIFKNVCTKWSDVCHSLVSNWDAELIYKIHFNSEHISCCASAKKEVLLLVSKQPKMTLPLYSSFREVKQSEVINHTSSPEFCMAKSSAGSAPLSGLARCISVTKSITIVPTPGSPVPIRMPSQNLFSREDELHTSGKGQVTLVCKLPHIV